MPILNRIPKAGRQLRDLLRVLPRACVRYRKGPVWVFGRGLVLVRHGWFSPAEALGLGLFDPDIEPGAARGYVAKRRITGLQDRLNPWSWREFARDKGLFYRYCEAMDIPTPRLLALVYRDGPGWTRDGRLVETRAGWAAFLATHTPAEFVVKPIHGHYGRDVRILRKDGEALVDHSGTGWSARRLIDDLLGHPDRFDFVIQERLRSHPDLAAVSGSRALQTVRVMTLAHDTGEIEILAAALKLGGSGLVDNFELGRTGNLLVEVEPSSGRLLRAWGAAPDAPGLAPVDRHPATDAVFADLTIPFWTEALALVERSARTFLPLRTLGWDVAITPTGASIIEANVWWDPLPFPGMAAIGRRVAAAARADSGGAR